MSTTTTTTTTTTTSTTSTTQPPGHISREISNPSLLQLASGDIFLFYDYVDEIRDDGSVISNIYKTLSNDSGVTWDIPDKITGYTTWGTRGCHPEAIEKSSGVVDLVYHEERTVLAANSDTLLWQNNCISPEYSSGTDLHFDPATSRLYVYQIYISQGNKVLCGIIVFDTTTWEVVRVYNTNSVPGYNSVFFEQHVWWHRSHGEGKYVTVSTTKSSYYCATLVINDLLETITEYVFKDHAAYGLITNIDIDWRSDLNEKNAQLYYTWIDADSDKLYIVFGFGYLYSPAIWVGYIDLNASADPITGKYVWNEILYDVTTFSNTDIVSIESVIVIPELNYMVICCYNDVTWLGRMVVISTISGGVIRDYSFTEDPSFPYYGVRYPVYYNGHIYASFRYTSLHNQENYSGIVDINIDTSVILYHRPTWASVDDYNIELKVYIGNSKILMAANIYGVTLFDITTGSWELYNNDTLPGFEPTDYDPCVMSVEYDAINSLILCGSTNPVGNFSFSGIRGFDEGGSLNQGKYRIGTLAGSWTFSDAYDFTIGLLDYNMSVAVTSDDIIWATWLRRDITEHSLKWDSDIADLDLSDYIASGSAVSVSWSVDGRNKLSFILSHGHLFDPNNLLSSLNPFLQKGRQINLRFGEKINNIDYWQKQGSYIVSSTRMSYSRGSYPTISAGCEDKSVIWGDIKLVATDRYDGTYPEDIVSDLLQDFIGMDAGDISIPNLDNRHEIHHQWVDDSFTDIIAELLDHFGYIPYLNEDDDFTVKQITVNGSVDHSYTGAEVINFSPDDNYSSLTNKVTVKGEGLYFVEVLYPEEAVASLSGSGGWWSDANKVERIYYSEDQQKKSRSPRLNVIISISDFHILWSQSGGTEEITAVDPDEHWVEVTIEFPGLMGSLLAAIALLITIGVASVECDGDNYCGVMLMLFSLAVAAFSYIIGQVATYEYEIFARPIGEEKQTIYADADDVDFQRYLNGQVVNEEIDDPFCYTVSSCQFVADQELDIVKAQRKRIVFDKIAHLQDEICDRIQVNHPYSNQPIDIFITNLKRVYIKPKRGLLKSNSFIDSITGWRI